MKDTDLSVASNFYEIRKNHHHTNDRTEQNVFHKRYDDRCIVTLFRELFSFSLTTGSEIGSNLRQIHKIPIPQIISAS